MYDILSPTPPLNRLAITEGRAPSSRPRRAAQPADLREGVAKAYDTVREVGAPHTHCLNPQQPSREHVLTLTLLWICRG